MRGSTRIARALSTVAAAAIAAVVAAPGAGAPTVKGDTAAWAQIVAAYRKLDALPGYRIKGRISESGPGGGTFVMEVAPPSHAWHSTAPTPHGTAEAFVIGDKFFQRLPGSPCTTGQDPSSTLLRDPADPRNNFVYTISRKPDSVIDGTPVHAYGEVVENPRDGQTVRVTVYIGAQTGLPRRIVSMSSGGILARTTTLDLYDYGAKITIVPPKCQTP
jgi:hypothetical protein